MNLDNETIKKVFSRYIGKIILPKYPEIVNFDINTNNNHVNNKLFVDFIFYTDGTEYDIEQEIVEKCLDMMEVFGISNINYGFSFETI